MLTHLATSAQYFRPIFFTATLIFLSTIVFISGCRKTDDNTKTVIEPTSKTKKGKVVTFVTLNSPNTYYVDGNKQFSGLEYDLAKLFVKELGNDTQLKLIVATNINQVISIILHHKADIAAADVTVTNIRKQMIDFSVPYQDVQQLVVYNTEKNKESLKKPPKSLKDLVGLHISLPASSSFVERLTKLQKTELGLGLM